MRTAMFPNRDVVWSVWSVTSFVGRDTRGGSLLGFALLRLRHEVRLGMAWMLQMSSSLCVHVCSAQRSSMQEEGHRGFEIGYYEGCGNQVVATRDIFDQVRKTNRRANRVNGWILDGHVIQPTRDLSAYGKAPCELKTLNSSKRVHVISPNCLHTSDSRICCLVVDTWDGEVREVVFLEPELVHINVLKDGDIAFDRVFFNCGYAEGELLCFVATRSGPSLLGLDIRVGLILGELWDPSNQRIDDMEGELTLNFSHLAKRELDVLGEVEIPAFAFTPE